METFNYEFWEPLSLEEVVALFSGASFSWGFAGGYAIELFAEKTIRAHSDIDVLILRPEQLAAQKHLSDWQLYWATRPGLKLWDKGFYIPKGYHDIWCRRHAKAPWQLQIMLMEVEDDSWVFRRNPDIRGPLKEMFLKNQEGIPFLRPEIQLLYKAKTELRVKDQIDFDASLPLLNESAKSWLLSCLKLQFPQGHIWIEAIEQY
jgi:hypothetical protein